MKPVYVRALREIQKQGIDHPNDFAGAVELISRLLDAGEEIDGPIDKHLENNGMQPQKALEVQRIYDVLAVLKKKRQPRYTDEFIQQDILKEPPEG